MPSRRDNPFWSEFRDFLGLFLENLTPLERLSDDHTASVWWREGQSGLPFDREETERYRRLLRRGRQLLAPHDELSRANIDRVLKDTMFILAQAKRSGADDLHLQISRALAEARRDLEGELQAFECWVEVEGFDGASLPARFGATDFVALDSEHIARLHMFRRSNQTKDLDPVKWTLPAWSGTIDGRIVAIRRVQARNQKAAIALAVREVAATLECLNCFAETIPYNGARLQVAYRQPGRQSSVRVSFADDGSVLLKPAAPVPWEYSMSRLGELTGIAGEAALRLDDLLKRDELSEVENLLLRGARWVGRAAAAHTTEDGIMYSATAVDCMMKPVERPTRTLIERAAHLLRDFVEPDDVRQLWKVRNELVHDGSLEVSETDRRELHAIALNLLARLLTCREVSAIKTLAGLDDHLSRLQANDDL